MHVKLCTRAYFDGCTALLDKINIQLVIFSTSKLRWYINFGFKYFCIVSRVSVHWTLTLIVSVLIAQVKVAQINYVSRNQLHSTANLNFGLMCKKAKHCMALSTNFSVQFS